MRFKKMIVVTAVGLGVLSVGGAALASSHSKATSKDATEVSQSVDTDNVEVQQGDQTAPDTAAATAESESTSETAVESDGPGGHADPDGQNVDHQFEGNE